MAWYIYDKNGYVDQIATYQGLRDLLNKFNTPLNKFITDTEADSTLQHSIVVSLRDTTDPELVAARDLIARCEPPIILTDGGGDPRIERFHSDSEYDNPNVKPVNPADLPTESSGQG
jgi:hypothetical protein